MTVRIDVEECKKLLASLAIMIEICESAVDVAQSTRRFGNDGVFGRWQNATGGFDATKGDLAFRQFCDAFGHGFSEIRASLETVEKTLKRTLSSAQTADVIRLEKW